MGHNRGYDRPMMVIEGLVKTEGGSMGLQKGQLGLVNNSITTPNGVAVIANTNGVNKEDKVFELRLGTSDKGFDRTRDNLSMSTRTFSLEEVVGLSVSAPTITEQKLDEIVLGYDGIDESKAFKFKPSDSYFRVTLEIEGGSLEYRGGGMCKELVSVDIQMPKCDPFSTCEDCDDCGQIDCRDIVQKAVEVLRRRQLTGGILVEEVVDIVPIFSCDTVPSTVEYNYWTLSVCDTGTDSALSMVGAQYDAPVKRLDRVGATSIYQVLLPSGVNPVDYKQSIGSVIKGCSDCPPGYDPNIGGYLYAFTVADRGSDLSSTFTTLPGYIANSVVKSGNSGTTGFYTALYENPLSQSDINSLTSGTSPAPTITVSLIGKAEDICKNDQVTEVSWVSGDVCGATQHTYRITLPDNECGQDRLEELNGAYPNLTITVADSIDSTLVVELDEGTTGETSDIFIGGDTYQIAFDTDYTTTASNFVLMNAGSILDGVAVTVTSDGNNLVFIGITEVIDAITITGGVNWSVLSNDVLPLRKSCQTVYETKVVTNIVCEECDPIFKDYYKSEAPQSLGQEKWELVEERDSRSDCLCGIRFKAKPFVLAGEEALRDEVGFVETSSRIRVSADYPTEIREGIGELPDSAAPYRYLSKQQHRTHLAGNLRDLENEGVAYFRDLAYQDSYLSRLLTGTTSHLEDQFKQYVMYNLKMRHKGSTQSFGAERIENINYLVFVEVGKHQSVESLLNNIAANAGKRPVQAFAN